MLHCLLLDWGDPTVANHLAEPQIVLVLMRHELDRRLVAEQRSDCLLRALPLRQVQVVKVLTKVITVDDDLVDLAGERWVDPCALEGVLKHPEQLLEVPTRTRRPTLVQECLL